MYVDVFKTPKARNNVGNGQQNMTVIDIKLEEVLLFPNNKQPLRCMMGVSRPMGVHSCCRLIGTNKSHLAQLLFV